MAVAFGRATPSLRQPPSRCLDNPVPGNIIFSLNGEHHLLLKVLHFRVDKRGRIVLSHSILRFKVKFPRCQLQATRQKTFSKTRPGFSAEG